VERRNERQLVPVLEPGWHWTRSGPFRANRRVSPRRGLFGRKQPAHPQNPAMIRQKTAQTAIERQSEPTCQTSGPSRVLGRKTRPPVDRPTKGQPSSFIVTSKSFSKHHRTLAHPNPSTCTRIHQHARPHTHTHASKQQQPLPPYTHVQAVETNDQHGPVHQAHRPHHHRRRER
jgi:hypothetical protein